MSAVTRHSPSGNSRVGRRLAGALVVLLLALAPGLPWTADRSLAVEPEASSSAAAETDFREQRVAKRVVRGDTLPRLLMDLGVSSAVRNRWLRAVVKQVGVAMS